MLLVTLRLVRLLLLLMLRLLELLIIVLLDAVGIGGVQVLSQASFSRPFRTCDRLQTVVQFTLKQSINEPEGISTLATPSALQHATNTQTSSCPSLEMVPGGLEQRELSVVNGRQVSAAAKTFVHRTIHKMIPFIFIAACMKICKAVREQKLVFCAHGNVILVFQQFVVDGTTPI
jgi:hypothetical protein